MKSFLLKNNLPVIKFSMLPDNIFYEGVLPGEEYSLAVCPTNEKMVIVDVDCKPGKVNGYTNIPENIFSEFKKSFHYHTKSGGMHIFLNYTGQKVLKNCATKFGIDLRIGRNKETGNAGGYVKWNSNLHPKDCIPFIKETSEEENKFLENLFS
jgi:hypothetical protein